MGPIHGSFLFLIITREIRSVLNVWRESRHGFYGDTFSTSESGKSGLKF